MPEGKKDVYKRQPLNGSGLVPVTHVLNDMGITDITIVPEQEYPNGYFTTCSYPNPETVSYTHLGRELSAPVRVGVHRADGTAGKPEMQQ